MMVRALLGISLLLTSLLLSAATPYDDAFTLVGLTGGCVGECSSEIPEFSDKYFVGAGGNDNADGRSHATRWATLNKVNLTVSSTGDDVYLLSDSVFENETLEVDWAGTAGDRIVIGTYCVDGSTPVEWSSGQPGCGAKAEINGTYTASCREPTWTCAVDTGSAVPSSQYRGLINLLQGVAAYTHVKDISLRDSAGEGFGWHGDSSVAGGHIIEGLDVYQAYGSGISLAGLGADDLSIIRNNVIAESSLIGTDNPGNNWSPCIHLRASVKSTKILIEDNVITECAGEGIGLQHVTDNIVRGNRISNTRRVLMYVDNGSRNVIENNELYGTGYGGGYQNGMGFGLAIESYSVQANAVDNIFRNNILGNVEDTGIWGHIETEGGLNGNPSNPSADGYQIGGWFYGNTMMLFTPDSWQWMLNFNYGLTTNNNVDNLQWASNVFARDNDCNWQAGIDPATYDFNYNAWEITPTNSNCTGANDVNGDVDIDIDVAAINGGNLPTPSAFKLGPDSIAAGAGDPSLDTAACLSVANYGSAFDNINGGNPPNEANWEKCLYYDFDGNVRNATAPSAGAFEYLAPEGAIPEDGTVYFVGTGGSDSNDGLSHATRWATLGKVNSTVSTTGADVYIQSGYVSAQGDYLTVDWAGTLSDRAVVGTYCVDGSTPVAWSAGGTGCGDRAQIRGNMTEAQAQANNFDWNAYPQGGCASVYDEAVLVQYNYTTVENLWIRESACSGLRVKGAGASGVGEGTLIGATIENNLIEYTGFTPLVAESGVQDLVVRGNTVRHYNKCEQSSTEGGTVPSPATNNCGSSGWPGGVGVVRSLNARALIEDNDIYLGYGEGINAYISSGVVIRGNRVGNTRSAVIYSDCARGQIIAEGNVLWGPNGNAGAGPGTFSSTPSLMSSSAEANCASGNGTNTLYRNNILLNGGEGLNASLEGTVAAAGELMGDEFYGNTIMASYLRTYDGVTNLTGNNFGSINAASNVFYSTSQSDAPRCRAEQTNNYNLWTSTPTDVDCRGGNDVTGDPALGQVYSYYQTFDYTTVTPTLSSFAPGAGSPALGAGDPTLDASVCISDPAYTDAFIGLMSYPFAPDPALWRRCNYYDAAGNVRSATAPDVGALESDATPSSDVIPQDGTVYFAGTGGSDSNDGLSHNTRWLTMNKVNQSVSATGADVYLLTDSVFSNEALVVDWSGTTSDRVTVGTYCANGSTPEVWASGGTGCGEKAKITGSMTQACRDAGTCTYTDPTYYSNLVAIDRDYVTLQNLKLEDALGRAVQAKGSNNPSGTITGTIIEGIDTNWTGGPAIVAEKDIYNTIVRDNTVDNAAHCRMQGGCAYAWPAALVITRVTNANALIENNTVYRSYAEGIGAYAASGVVIRGNRVGDVHSGNIYIGGSRDVVIEHNITWQGPDDYYRGSNSPPAFGNVAANVEDFHVGSAYYENVENVIIRNNLMVGRGRCIDTALDTAAISAGWLVGVQAYGNTCVAGNEANYSTRTTPPANFSQLVVKNLLSYTTDASSGECVAPNFGTFNYNMWTGAVEADCTGANDQTGTNALAEPSMTVWRAYAWNNQPTVDDFRLQPGAAAIGAGDPSLRTASVLNASIWPIISEARYPFVPDTINWEKALYYDFEGTVRSATTPDIGALEN